MHSLYVIAKQSVLPGVKLLPVPADSMAQSGGAVHCITMGLSLPWNAGPLSYLFAFMREHSSWNLNK